MASRIRIHVEQPLSEGQTVPLAQSHAHYLFSVMRRGAGDAVDAFNGRDGNWECEISEVSRKSGAMTALRQTAPQRDPPDLWLIFAPIKKGRTDFIVEKAAELGAARILPVQTEHTNSERVRRDRLQAHAVEAAEQCGGTYVPPVDDIVPLDRLLDDWPAERRLMFCDEALAEAGGGALEAGTRPAGPWAILIGPEGGFSQAERARLAALGAARPVRLGPRILRADTAAVAALTLWQDQLGGLAVIRPELVERFLRWREATIGSGAALLGLYWAVADTGIMRWVGLAFILGGVAILREGLARGRRPRDGGGAGVVDVSERQIAYLSAHGGGVVSLDALDRVAVERPQRGTARWLIDGTDGTRLAIPLDAEGAGQIFDAIAALPGLGHAETLAATRAATPGNRILWQKDRPRLH